MGYLLVYGSYEGQVWLKGIAPFLVMDQNPFRAHVVTSHFSLMNVCVHFQLELKKTLFLTCSKTEYIHSFLLKSYTCLLMYEMLSCRLTASLPSCSPKYQLHLLCIFFLLLNFTACLSIVWCYSQLPLNSLAL